MNLKCFLRGHDWSYGRVASQEAQQLLDWKVMHNRYCLRCDKEDWAADRAEDEIKKRKTIKNALHGTRRILEDDKGD